MRHDYRRLQTTEDEREVTDFRRGGQSLTHSVLNLKSGRVEVYRCLQTADVFKPSII